eukprot:sb/3461834/
MYWYFVAWVMGYKLILTMYFLKSRSLDLALFDIHKLPQGYQMRIDYAWTYQTYEQPNGNTLIEVNCSNLYALDNTQICFRGCSLPKVDNSVISPLPSRSKVGAPYNEGESIELWCGEDVIRSTCKGSEWSNLSEYSCPTRNISARSMAIVLDTTTNMEQEIKQLGRSCRVLPYYKISSLYLIRGWSNDRGKIHKTQVRAILAWVFLYGGKDCPELTLAAVQRAITESYPGSEIFVFTDASSKEEDRRIVIMEEATRKRIKVNFILTGHCSDNQLEEQAVYYEIADATSGFLVSVDKAQVREISSLMSAALMANEGVLHEVFTVGSENPSAVVKIPCDKRVQRMTVTVTCDSVRIINARDDKDNDVRFHQVSTLRDMITISLQPSIAGDPYLCRRPQLGPEHVNLNVSCVERGTAVVSAQTITDIDFTYQFYLYEVHDTLVETDTLVAGSTAVIYVMFGAPVYDVDVTTMVSNQPDGTVPMKKYLRGFMATITVPTFNFHLQFTAKYSGQTVQRVSTPIIPRSGCRDLPSSSSLVSTLQTHEGTVVSFSCSNECQRLSHDRELRCEDGVWSEQPPTCHDAGYTCGTLKGPGNGTLMFNNQILYTLASAKCGQSAEVHCNTFFKLNGEERSTCTPYGWSNKVNTCVGIKKEDKTDTDTIDNKESEGGSDESREEVTKVLVGLLSNSTRFRRLVRPMLLLYLKEIRIGSGQCSDRGGTKITMSFKGKRKDPLRMGYERAPIPRMGETDALAITDDIYEVVDTSGNYPPGCYSNGPTSCRNSRPPLPPPLSNPYGNPTPGNLASNPLYSRTASSAVASSSSSGLPLGNDYMRMSGDIRSTSIIYEEMAARQQQPEYDYATGHLSKFPTLQTTFPQVLFPPAATLSFSLSLYLSISLSLSLSIPISPSHFLLNIC